MIRLVSDDTFGQILITDCNPTRLKRILDKAGGDYTLFVSRRRRRDAGAGRGGSIRRKARPGMQLKTPQTPPENASENATEDSAKGAEKERSVTRINRRKQPMRRTKTMLMGDLLEEFFKRPYIAAKVAEGKLPDTWREIVGDRAADVTTELRLEKHILYVRIQSSVLRSELFYQREALKEEINRRSGVRLVNAVIIR